MMIGYIKLHRALLGWEWYDCGNTFRLFMHCLLKANFKDKKWRGIKIKRGSFLTSVKKLAEELNISGSKIQTAINHLKSTGEITIKTTNKYSIISVLKYDTYQAVENENHKQNSKQNNKQMKNKSKSNLNQISTTNKDKKEKKEKKEKKIYAEFVSMTQKEYQILCDDYTQEIADKCIDKLDNYKGANGKKYKSDYRAILSWVLKEVVDEHCGKKGKK